MSPTEELKEFSVSNEADEWIDNPEAINKAAFHHFTRLHSKLKNGNYHQIVGQLACPKLTQDHIRKLNHPFSKQEIWEAINLTQPDKTTGPDGFSARFFQHFWNIIGQDVEGLVHSFLNSGYLLNN